MPSLQEIKSFYDGFLPRLAVENGRHRRVYQSLDMLPKGKVLDLGCGAGLSSKRLADGGRDVVAVDFSPAAIEYARQHNGSDRITYVCEDVTTFTTKDKFDAICMIDVLEHLDNPLAIIRLLQDSSNDNTIIYLNIPYSETIGYLKWNRPELLQPIDNPEGIGETIDLFSAIGFFPFKMELYWMQYVEYFFCTQKKFNQFMEGLYRKT